MERVKAYLQLVPDHAQELAAFVATNQVHEEDCTR